MKLKRKAENSPNESIYEGKSICILIGLKNGEIIRAEN
jgi:hypothetical protein